MFTFFPRSTGHTILLSAFAVCLAVLIGDPSGAAGQDRAVGDIWRGEAPEPTWGGGESASGYALRSARHQAFMQGGVPAEYRNARSPYPAAEKFIREGGEIYAAQCARCHGAQGFGDGEVAMDLRPTPAFLAFMIDSPDLVDEYLMWTVAEGGVEFGSDMPAFKDTLTNREIWKIVVFMRAGFPPAQD